MIEPTEEEIAYAAAECLHWGIWGPFGVHDEAAIISNAMDDAFSNVGLKKSSDAIAGFLFGLNIGLRILAARTKATPKAS